MAQNVYQSQPFLMARFRAYLFYVMLGLAILGLGLLWFVSLSWRRSLSPPGWVAVCIILLPYLYALLLGFSCVLCFAGRKKSLLLLPAAIVLSIVGLWGHNFLPNKGVTPPAGVETLKALVWNVERLGQYSEGPRAVPEKTECVAQLLTQEQPDIMAFLEVTYEQLAGLQKRLGIPADHCIWTDYYGTGRQKSGGLATCISHGNPALSISRRREMALPPDWKYLFLEIQHKHEDRQVPFNFLTLHIAPPQVSSEKVGKILKDMFSGKKQGLTRALQLLKNYEKRVTLQGAQAVDALGYIEERFKDPTLIAGDFNSSQDAALHLRFRERLFDTWAAAGWGLGATRFWGDFLPLRIDYIYATTEFSVQRSQTFPADCSDHRPVMSSVFLTPSKK